MSQICPRITLAHPAAAIGIERTCIRSIARLLDGDFSFRGKQQAVAGGARGQDAIHHIDAQTGVFNDLLGRAYSHHIARLVGGKVFERGCDDLAGAFAGLADAEASDGIARKANFDGALGGFLCEREIHPALDDAEQGLGRLPSPRRLVGSTFLRVLGTRYWVLTTVPRNFVLVLLEILLAAFSPAQG